MNIYHFVNAVKQQVDGLVSQNKWFTVFDITRLLQFKYKSDDSVMIDHNLVRTVVEDYWQDNFGVNSSRPWDRIQYTAIAGEPQLYFNNDKVGGYTAIRQYDKDANDPNPKKLPAVATTVITTLDGKEYVVFAVKFPDGTYAGRSKGYRRRSNNVLCKAMFWDTKNGPSQVMNNYPGGKVVRCLVKEVE
jgi:hypothetical protein